MPPPAYSPTPGAVDLAARSRVANLRIYQPSHQPFAFPGLKEARHNVTLFPFSSYQIPSGQAKLLSDQVHHPALHSSSF